MDCNGTYSYEMRVGFFYITDYVAVNHLVVSSRKASQTMKFGWSEAQKVVATLFSASGHSAIISLMSNGTLKCFN